MYVGNIAGFPAADECKAQQFMNDVSGGLTIQDSSTLSAPLPAPLHVPLDLVLWGGGVISAAPAPESLFLFLSLSLASSCVTVSAVSVCYRSVQAIPAAIPPTTKTRSLSSEQRPRIALPIRDDLDLVLQCL